jgi:hypothetical protein
VSRTIGSFDFVIATDDDDELQLKSAPANAMLLPQNGTDSVELKKLSTSIGTMRTSVLQA